MKKLKRRGSAGCSAHITSTDVQHVALAPGQQFAEEVGPQARTNLASHVHAIAVAQKRLSQMGKGEAKCVLVERIMRWQNSGERVA